MKHKQKHIDYYIINIVFLLMAILYVNYNGIFQMKFSVEQLLILIAFIGLIHTLKFVRMYFILLEEEKGSLLRMVKIYIKTTFVSIVLPYKTGEIFKMYSFGNEINDYPKGIIAVLIDKFFDAVILCGILVPYEILTKGRISNLSFIILSFIIIILIIYLSFEGTYYYLNRFLVIKSTGRKSLITLNILEKLNHIYQNAKKMLNGRQLVLLSLSAIIWIMESVFIYIMEMFANVKINLATIVNYVSDAFFGTNNQLFNNYIYLCTAIFIMIIIYMYFKKLINGGKKLWEK